MSQPAEQTSTRSSAHLRFSGDLNDRFLAFAKREKRSLANAILFLAVQKLDEMEGEDAVYTTTSLDMQSADPRPS